MLNINVFGHSCKSGIGGDIYVFRFVE